MTHEYIDILRNVRDNHGIGTYQKALDAAIEAMEEVERIRGERNGPKPLTNAQHIRAMTDEELAELFCRADFCEVCDQLRPTGTCMAMETETEGPLSKHCVAAALRWLQQSAEGGEG